MLCLGYWSFPGKRYAKKHFRESSAFGMISLSLSTKLFRHTQTHHHHHRPIRRRLIGKSSYGRRRRRRRRERKSVAFSFLWSFFVFFLFCVVGLFYYASNSFLVRRIEWPSAAPRRLRTTTKTTKTRTEGRRRRVGK